MTKICKVEPRPKVEKLFCQWLLGDSQIECSMWAQHSFFTGTIPSWFQPFWNVFTNGPSPASVFFYFRSFQANNVVLTKMSCPSSISCQDSNPWPLEHQSSPITTRPGLPPYSEFIFRLQKSATEAFKAYLELPILKFNIFQYQKNGPFYSSLKSNNVQTIKVPIFLLSKNFKSSLGNVTFSGKSFLLKLIDLKFGFSPMGVISHRRY